MKQKLNAKDFILIGILTALMWIICMIISTIMSVAGPVTNVFYPSVVAIPNGIVMMLSYLVMQDTDYQLFASSVEEELSLGMQEDCKEKIDAVLNALELSDYRERHPASLSGGQKQRVTIGVAIVKDSPVIYFDEPTSGLDYDSMVRVSKLIEQLSDSGVIVFVVSHDFEFIVRTCTEVVQLDDDGTIQNQQLSPTVLKSLSEKYFT